jgi:hypothetical protein
MIDPELAGVEKAVEKEVTTTKRRSRKSASAE